MKELDDQFSVRNFVGVTMFHLYMLFFTYFVVYVLTCITTGVARAGSGRTPQLIEFVAVLHSAEMITVNTIPIVYTRVYTCYQKCYFDISLHKL